MFRIVWVLMVVWFCILGLKVSRYSVYVSVRVVVLCLVMMKVSRLLCSFVFDMWCWVLGFIFVCKRFSRFGI